jgi:hypothetical protein
VKKVEANKASLQRGFSACRNPKPFTNQTVMVIFLFAAGINRYYRRPK